MVFTLRTDSATTLTALALSATSSGLSIAAGTALTCGTYDCTGNTIRQVRLGTGTVCQTDAVTLTVVNSRKELPALVMPKRGTYRSQTVCNCSHPTLGRASVNFKSRVCVDMVSCCVSVFAGLPTAMFSLFKLGGQLKSQVCLPCIVQISRSMISDFP
jgi:hypothetical protein